MTNASRVCLVTGATSGIGRAAAAAFARDGYTVVVASRNAGKCAAVAAELRLETRNEMVEPLGIDLGSLASVRTAAEEFRHRHDRLHLLVNNAGISPGRRRETTDGFEATFGINHLGHFLLTGLLLDLLLESAPSRIINVSSNIYKQARLDFDNLHLRRGFSAMKAYANSKLANLLFTTELARRLAGTGVTANAMTPGLTKTNIGMEEGWFYAASKRLADTIGGKTAEQGADTLVWLATSPDVTNITGQYFDKRRSVPLSRAAADASLAKQLWQVSEQLVGLRQGG